MNARRIALALLAALVLSGCTPADTPDCEADDRAAKEQPDCGFAVKGIYREWSWVKAGKTHPPAGWSAAKEKKAAAAPTRTVSR